MPVVTVLHRAQLIAGNVDVGEMEEVHHSPRAEQRARLLVVDDEANLRAVLRDILSLMGYHVEEAESGYEALKLLDSSSYDLMLLDIRMPGMSGVEVMNHARESCPDMSIIILTAHATLESAVAAVRLGAVDYMLKPFNVEDLGTTISQALEERSQRIRDKQLLKLIGDTLSTLRQIEAPAESPSPPLVPQKRYVHGGPVTLDRQKRQATVGEDLPRTVDLTENETIILVALMERPNQVRSCVELARAATGYDLDRWEAQNLVRLCVHRLRRKIETDARKPALIRNVRGRGYFFSPNQS